MVPTVIYDTYAAPDEIHAWVGEVLKDEDSELVEIVWQTMEERASLFRPFAKAMRLERRGPPPPQQQHHQPPNTATATATATADADGLEAGGRGAELLMTVYEAPGAARPYDARRRARHPRLGHVPGREVRLDRHVFVCRQRLRRIEAELGSIGRLLGQVHEKRDRLRGRVARRGEEEVPLDRDIDALTEAGLDEKVRELRERQQPLLAKRVVFREPLKFLSGNFKQALLDAIALKKKALGKARQRCWVIQREIDEKVGEFDRESDFVKGTEIQKRIIDAKDRLRMAVGETTEISNTIEELDCQYYDIIDEVEVAVKRMEEAEAHAARADSQVTVQS